MKKYLVILLLLITHVCSGQIGIVTHTITTGSANTVTSAAINTTGAGLIVVQIAAPNVAVGTLSDSKGNTWTILRNDAILGLIANLTFYCVSPVVGSSHTFTYAATGAYPVITVVALSNVASSPIDQQNGAHPISTTISVQPGSITPSVNNEIILASICVGASGTIPTINSGFTILNSMAFASGVNQGSVMAYITQTSASAVNPTFSWTATAYAATSIVSIKPSLTNSSFFILAQ